jgi:hypothetical protein
MIGQHFWMTRLGWLMGVLGLTILGGGCGREYIYFRPAESLQAAGPGYCPAPSVFGGSG